jgi:multiple sugar transport system ATP-binding protein
VDKLVLNHVYKNYGNVQAVRDINFTVKENEFVTIVGPSGCGKSSTLRMIAGLENITDGDLILDGEKINDIPARERNVALAFENYSLYPHLTVSGNLSFPLEAARTNKHETKQKVKDILKLLNLEKFENKRPGELSGGQQQRVSLGRALIRDASIYLLDEPLSHLDAQERVELRAQLQRIQKLNGLTFILVTHDQQEALALSDRIIIMSEGRIQQIGTPEEIYDTPANLFVADFIGEPPMNFLNGIIIKRNEKFIQKCGDAEFILPARNREKLSEFLDKEVTLGIRPHNINLLSGVKEGINSNEGTVFSYEYLGDNGYLILSCSDFNILIEVESTEKYNIDDKVNFYFKEDSIFICLFDKNTGSRII